MAAAAYCSNKAQSGISGRHASRSTLFGYAALARVCVALHSAWATVANRSTTPTLEAGLHVAAFRSGQATKGGSSPKKKTKKKKQKSRKWSDRSAVGLTQGTHPILFPIASTCRAPPLCTKPEVRSPKIELWASIFEFQRGSDVFDDIFAFFSI